MQAPIGKPPPSPFASVTRSGVMPVGLVSEPGAAAPDAGLHLVDPQQGAVRARSARGPRARNPSGGTMTPFSPWIGSSEDGGDGVVHRGGQRVGVPVRHEHDLTRQRLERLAVRRACA